MVAQNIENRDPVTDTARLLAKSEYPSTFAHIYDPPTQLYIRGSLPPAGHKTICVIGSRAYSGYGKDACQMLIEGLRGYPISIISGLAIGIDSIAHQAALDVGLHTVAFPGSSLEDAVLYPRMHLPLAHAILKAGGALISESEPYTKAAPYSFPKRNRLMAAMADAIVVIESSKASGTHITATLGLQQGKTILAVPGSIFSEKSEGNHMLIKDGAIPIRTSADILATLSLIPERTGELLDEKQFLDCNDDEKALLHILRNEHTRDELLDITGFTVSSLIQLITILELKQYITEKAGYIRRIR